MPLLTVTRAGGWADRFRPYTVVVDGEHLGLIRPKQSLSFEVPFGQHHVRLLAGLLYGSPVLRVHVDARGLTLLCGSNKRLGAALGQMMRPDGTVWLRVEPPPDVAGRDP